MFSVHFRKKINQFHIKIYQTIIRKSWCIWRIIHTCMLITPVWQKKTHSARLLIIADKIKHSQKLFSSAFTESSSKLLEKNYRRFRRPEEHYHINWCDIHTFIKHIHWKNHSDFALLKLPNSYISILCVFAACIAEHCYRWYSPFWKFFCHLPCMLPWTAETKRLPWAVFTIIFVNQLISANVAYIGFI